MRGQTYLKLMRKGVNWIENQEENLYNCLKSAKLYILVKNYTNFRS